MSLEQRTGAYVKVVNKMQHAATYRSHHWKDRRTPEHIRLRLSQQTHQVKMRNGPHEISTSMSDGVIETWRVSILGANGAENMRMQRYW